MKNEYYIKKLWFTGPGIEDSPVEFINGLNIIHGANDTGKSWILDSFDFMCGLDHEKVRNRQRAQDAIPYTLRSKLDTVPSR